MATALPAQARHRWPDAALLAVGAVFLILQVLLVPRPFGLSIDEATYLAKVDPAVPELVWTAPRAWGVPVLAAPVALFSAGLTVLRAWFALLASVGLVAAFWPWRRVLPPGVAPVAALFFATFWVTLYYGSLAMPNLYVALGAVGVTGLALRYLQQPTRWRLLLAGAVVVLVALVRPTDSVLLVGPMVLVVLAAARLRDYRLVVALVVGGLLGWLPWLVEGWLRFGGPLARLRAAETSGPQGLELRLTNAVTVLRMLDGFPLYCCYGGPAEEAGGLPRLLSAWAIAVLLAAVAGLLLAARRGQLPQMLLVTVPAAALGGFYLLLPSFITLRFLLPALALLSLPVAAAVVLLLTGSRGRRRTLLAGLVVVAVVVHLGLMLPRAERMLREAQQDRILALQLADAVRPLTDGRPCLVLGTAPRATSFYLRCAVRTKRPGKRPPSAYRRAQAEQRTVVAIVRGDQAADSYLARWTRVPVEGLPGRWQVYVPPAGG